MMPTLLRLQISRFRGIEALDWYPYLGLNLILGGGDVGKAAISPTQGVWAPAPRHHSPTS